MNNTMGWIDFWNEKIKQFSIWDMKLVQIWTAAWILLIVKLIPRILQPSIWWFVAVIGLCGLRFFYIIFFRKEDLQGR